VALDPSNARQAVGQEPLFSPSQVFAVATCRSATWLKMPF